MSTLTERQARVLKIIQSEKQRSGIEPSLTQLAQKLKMNVNGASGHLKALERKGFLKRPIHARAGYYQLVEIPEDSKFSSYEIPLLGEIAAGFAKESYEQSGEVLDLRRESFGKQVFALNVRGESMSEDGIIDNDTVIISTQISDIKDQSIFAVCIRKNEVTLKRIKKLKLDGKEYIELVPSNKNFKNLKYPIKDVEIIGKMVGLVRKY